MTTEVASDASAAAAESEETPSAPEPVEAPTPEPSIEEQIGPEPPDEDEEPQTAATLEPGPIDLAVHGANVGTDEPDEDDILDLTSIVPPRKLVRIPTKANPKGEVHELRLLDDFGIEEQQQLLSWSKRFEALWNKDGKDLTPKERVKMRWLLNAMFWKVLDAPDEVKRNVDDTIKSRVVTAFTMVPLLERQRREAQEEAEREANLPNGDLPSTES